MCRKKEGAGRAVRGRGKPGPGRGREQGREQGRGRCWWRCGGRDIACGADPSRPAPVPGRPGCGRPAVILSHGRRYVFIHIPKTGGTSLALALENRAMAADILVGDTPKARRRRGRLKGLRCRGRLWKHSRLADLQGLIGQEEMERYTVFTLVRNPWDRVVSYYHWLRVQGFDHPAVALARELPFGQFVAQKQIRAGFANDAVRAYVSDGQGVDRGDIFVRLEHLAEDLPRLEAALGLRLGKMPHENRSTRGDFRGYYTDDSAALVGAAFAEDIVRFGYGFDDPASQNRGAR